MSLPPALQNKNVQIGVIAVAILIALVFVFYQLMGSNSPPPETTLGAGAPYMAPGGGPPGGPPGPGGYPGGTGGAYPGPGGSGGYPMGSGGPGSIAGGYGSDMAGGGAPLAGAGKTPVKKAGPRPPARKDPFKAPPDQIVEPPPISASLPASNGIYIDSRIKEINTPTPDQFIRDTPDPPMRMAGALFGNRVYGVLEINGSTQVVNPGDKVGIYRVERVERDKIVMSRPGRKGRRTVEAVLAGNPSLAGQYPTGDSSIPGGPSGYGGPPAGGGGSSGGGSSR